MLNSEDRIVNFKNISLIDRHVLKSFLRKVRELLKIYIVAGIENS